VSKFPFYIQQAVDLDLLQADGDKIVSCREDAVKTVMGTARLIEKIQPTTAAKTENTTDQEAIVLCRVLSSPSGKARELWAQLRTGFGVGHGQPIPQNLWSTPVFKAIGGEIDRTFMGERNSAVISRESLITQFADLNEANRLCGMAEFNKTITDLAQPETMESYGDGKSEWDTALDLLRQFRVRALYRETLHDAGQVGRSDSKLEKSIEFLQQRSMECLGLLRGSIGQQNNFVSLIEDLIGDESREGYLDKIMNKRGGVKPISTGCKAFDVDMEGGIMPPNGFTHGGRLFTIAGRTGEGKTQLGVSIAANAVAGGLTVGFISAELDEDSIKARVWSSLTHVFKGRSGAIFSGKLQAPDEARKEQTCATLMEVGQEVQARGGNLLAEAPWGANADTVVATLRSMKARNPELRLAVLDHFHALAKHKGAPSNEATAQEERAYKLMTAAKELDIDLIVLAQMNRVGMDAIGKTQPPTLDQIRGTDALAHVSHAVWILRKQVEVDDMGEKPVHRTTGKLELWHAKVRSRQAVWKESTQTIEGIGNFIDKSILQIHHPTSTVEWDDTNA